MCSRPDCLSEECSEEQLSFRCKVKSISLGFTYGKACFHGPTIKEKQEKLFKEQAAAGNTIESATRWV